MCDCKATVPGFNHYNPSANFDTGTPFQISIKIIQTIIQFPKYKMPKTPVKQNTPSKVSKLFHQRFTHMFPK